MNVAKRTIPALSPVADKMLAHCDQMLADCLVMIEGIRRTYQAMERDTDLAMHPKTQWRAIAAMQNDEALAVLST